MKNKNLNENFNVSIYAEGPNPTGRDLQNLTAMFEVASFIAMVNLLQEEKGFSFWKMEEKYSDFIRSKYEIASDESFNKLADLVLASLVRMPYLPEEFDPKFKERRWFRDLDEEIHLIRRELHRGGERLDNKSLRSGADFNDLNEWLSLDYGNRLVEVSEINTKNSIEVIFNICSMAAILGFQHMPEVKDSVLYIESVFKGWLSKEPIKEKNSEIKLPSLPISLERTISKYDEVVINQKNDGWEIKLKRNS